MPGISTRPKLDESKACHSFGGRQRGPDRVFSFLGATSTVPTLGMWKGLWNFFFPHDALEDSKLDNKSHFGLRSSKGKEGVDGMMFGHIAPDADAGFAGCILPTVIAISGEEQHHVDEFFRAWRAETKHWQVIVPLRPEDDFNFLFDSPGVELVLQLMAEALDPKASKKLGTYGVDGSKFHLVGIGNGAASVLAIAAKAPELVASLILINGFVPADVKDVSPLAAIPEIVLYSGFDECGQLDTELRRRLEASAIQCKSYIAKGASYSSTGSRINVNTFWRRLEKAGAMKGLVREDSDIPL